jgi:hypothetical protein
MQGRRRLGVTIRQTAGNVAICDPCPPTPVPDIGADHLLTVLFFYFFVCEIKKSVRYLIPLRCQKGGFRQWSPPRPSPAQPRPSLRLGSSGRRLLPSRRSALWPGKPKPAPTVLVLYSRSGWASRLSLQLRVGWMGSLKRGGERKSKRTVRTVPRFGSSSHTVTSEKGGRGTALHCIARCPVLDRPGGGGGGDPRLCCASDSRRLQYCNCAAARSLAPETTNKVLSLSRPPPSRSGAEI